MGIFSFYFNSGLENKIVYEEGTKLFQHAPDFQTEYLNGSKFQLSDLKGKAVILNFWATWCPPCIIEMPRLQEFYEKNGGKVVVVGINLGEKKSKIEVFIKKLNITYPIIIDRNKELEKKYNILLKPTTYFINNEGIIIDKKLGEIREKDLEDRGYKLLKPQK